MGDCLFSLCYQQGLGWHCHFYSRDLDGIVILTARVLDGIVIFRWLSVPVSTAGCLHDPRWLSKSQECSVCNRGTKFHRFPNCSHLCKLHSEAQETPAAYVHESMWQSLIMLELETRRTHRWSGNSLLSGMRSRKHSRLGNVSLSRKTKHAFLQVHPKNRASSIPLTHSASRHGLPLRR